MCCFLLEDSFSKGIGDWQALEFSCGVHTLEKIDSVCLGRRKISQRRTSEYKLDEQILKLKRWR